MIFPSLRQDRRHSREGILLRLEAVALLKQVAAARAVRSAPTWQADENRSGVNAQCSMPNAQCPMPNAQCPMPNAQCPMPNAQCPMPNAQYEQTCPAALSILH